MISIEELRKPKKLTKRRSKKKESGEIVGELN
jgi:hypothetical protein